MNKVLRKVGPTDKEVHFDSFFFRDCPDEAAKDVRRSDLKRSKFLFDMLKAYLQSEFDSASKVRTSDYTSASWVAEQAHRNGKLEAFENIWKLLP